MINYILYLVGNKIWVIMLLILFYTQSNMEGDILRYIIFTFFLHEIYYIGYTYLKQNMHILFYFISSIDNLYAIRL